VVEATMSVEELTYLRELLDEASTALDEVNVKRMFGCDGFFASGGIFALVWKEGRIGIRLPEQDSYDKLLGESGAEPWRIMGKQMKHWVLVPADYHDDADSLWPWLRQAHALAASAPAKKPGKKTPSAAAKKRKPGPRAR
jgi:TfoX/Sxy family transcriptional regulator of competence genes